MKRGGIILIAVAVGSLLGAAPADASPELRRAAILTTMTEAALASASLTKDRLDSRNEEWGWSVQFSDRDWLFTTEGYVGDVPINFTMTGYLWGEDNESWIVSYAGHGNVGPESIRMNGQTVWHFDAALSDYAEMDFRHVMKFGSNSFWGWVLGAEVIVGGAIGGVGGGVTAGPAGAITGAMMGGAALVGASAAAKSLVESDEPVPAPPAPSRPEVPSDGESLDPTEGMIITAVSLDGEIWGSGPDGDTLLVGEYSSDEGTVSGAIFE